MSTEALFLNGTVGVGKTTVGLAVGDLLAAAHVPHAVIDVDWLRRGWPPPRNDPFDTEMALRNLRAVATSFRDRSAQWLVVAGVLETQQERGNTAEALGGPMTVCRLAADPEVVHARLTQRHPADTPGLRWHLQRADELAAILDDAAVQDFCVEVTALTPSQAAAEVAAAMGWRTAG